MSGTTLGTAYVQIVPKAEGIEGSITEVLGGEAESSGISLGSKIGSFAKKALVAAGIGTAVVKGFKAAISEGAKLQQSYIGGLDTLYGDAAEAARAHAREASAMGISMNDYAEQAVSFGAALKSAYGGDSLKAAEAANTAIMDMTDNAAKMGTPLESIQNAYQGFAKQNYTMLDNLKLGYGGTKSEMERLLKDAEKISGVKYDLNNLGDVYDAIHVIQGDLELTGVAAQEASETFSGSFAAMKASASNFFGSLALGEDIQPALTNLITSANTFFFNNLIPMIGTIAKGIPTVISGVVAQAVPMLVNKFVSAITSIGSKISSLADNLTADKVKAWATTTGVSLLRKGAELVGKLATALINNLPKIVGAIGRIGLAIIKGLGSAIWPKITAAANGIKEKFLAPINALKDKIKAIIDKIKGFFGFSVGKPHIPLPHFSINPPGWKLGDLLKGTMPKLGISWYAKGGIATGPSIAGVGEAGHEAILPLNPFWKKMDQIIEATRSGSGGVTINVYASPGMDVNQLASAVEQKLIKTTQRRRTAWGTV